MLASRREGVSDLSQRISSRLLPACTSRMECTRSVGTMSFSTEDVFAQSVLSILSTLSEGSGEPSTLQVAHQSHAPVHV